MKKRRLLSVSCLALTLGLGLVTLTNCDEGISTVEGTKYKVNYAESKDYTVSGLKSEGYSANETVTFTVTPSEGKQIVSVSVNGTNLNGNGTYSFPMPSGDATIVITVENAHNFDVTFDGTWATGNTLTATATIDETPYSGDLTIKATSGSDLVTISGNEVTCVGAGEVTLEISTTFDGATYTTTKTFTIVLVDYSISQITTGGEYIIRGEVVAKNTRAVLVTDGIESIYVYDQYEEDILSGIDIGDYVQVDGTVSSYNGFLQFSYGENTPLTVTEVTNGPDINIPAATPLTVDIANSFNGTQFSQSDIKLYSWTSVAGNEGGYTTLNLDGSSVLIEPSYIDSDIFNFVEGLTYNVEAYFVGYNSKHKYASIMLTKAELVLGDDLTVTATDTDLVVGETTQLTVTQDGEPAAGVTYTSSDQKVATVSDTGVVTGIGRGNAIITVTLASNPSIKGEILINVTNASTEIVDATIAEVYADRSYDGSTLYRVTGQISSITNAYYGEITLTDGEGNEIELYNSNYSESHESVSFINGKWDYDYKNGTNLEKTPIRVGMKVTALVFGDTSDSGFENYYGVITSYEEVKATAVDIAEPSSTSIAINQKIFLQYTTNPTLCSSLPTWESSDNTILTVDQNGAVKGVKSGQATVTLTVEDGVKDEIVITVTGEVAPETESVTFKWEEGYPITDNQIVMEQKDITITHSKGTSTSNLINNKAEWRWYKGHEIRFTSATHGITKIEFNDSNNGSLTVSETGVSVIQNGSNFVIYTDSFNGLQTITLNIGAQIRVNSVTVTYTK